MTPDEFSNSRYILDAASVEVEVINSLKSGPDDYRKIAFPNRVQTFSLTYYADVMDDDAERPEDLCDSEANELARDVLREYVSQNRLTALGRIISDGDVDGAEPVEARHELEYTIYYVIEEDMTGVKDIPNYDPYEQGQPYFDRADAATQLGNGGYAHRGKGRSTFGMDDSRVSIGEFLADVRAGVADAKR